MNLIKAFNILSLCFLLLADSIFAQVKVRQHDTRLSEVSARKILPTLLKYRDTTWNRGELLRAVNNSLRFMRSADGRKTYQDLNDITATHDRVLVSLERFRYVLLQSINFDEFVRRVGNEFELYEAPRADGSSQVKFTGYFQPIYKASRTKNNIYRYPIYKKPAGFSGLEASSHPTRVALEGYDGMGSNESILQGQELAYLKTRWEAFMIHVQGSAILELGTDNQDADNQDGDKQDADKQDADKQDADKQGQIEKMAVGFDSATDYPFRGIPKSFMQQYNVAWQRLGEFFEKNPSLLNGLLAKNNRYIFFKENLFPDPIGSLGVPVIAERSIATDKSQFPPGALGLIYVSFPRLEKNTNKITLSQAAQFVLDQDTGSAIKGRARVDVFMGTGNDGQKKASHFYTKGELYYLLLK